MEYNNRLYHAGGEPPDINDGANLGDRVVKVMLIIVINTWIFEGFASLHLK